MEVLKGNNNYRTQIIGMNKKLSNSEEQLFD